MEYAFWDEFVHAFLNWEGDYPTTDDMELVVNAAPFVEYNIEDEGYLSSEPDDVKRDFAACAETTYFSVQDVIDDSANGWLLVTATPYSFTIPMGDYVEFGFEPL